LGKLKLTDIMHEKHLYLTTVGRVTGRSHTVELWFAVSDGNMYLSHEGSPTDWMKNLQKTDHVEITVTDKRFTGRARIISDIEVFNRGKNALYHKYYDDAPAAIIDDWFSESSIIEISAIESNNHMHR
jgi:hypothetical protein